MGGPQWHGHVGNLLTASGWPEQFVEHVAEPSLEYVDLGVRDWRARGPIVDDTPGLNVVSDRTTKARPGRVLDEKIVGQGAEFGAPMTVMGAKGRRSGHADSIARTADKRNSAILRGGALDVIVSHVSRLVLGETASPRNTSAA